MRIYLSSNRTANNACRIDCALDAADRRIRTALPDGSAWDYAYDDLGQLTSAQRDSTNTMAYAYDTIGNRQTATEDAVSTTYTANDLNQYTAINQEQPTYDADGNLLTNAGWTYHWNAENRLIRAENGTVRVEADYDYQGRRFEKKVFYGNTLTQHQYFLYDGYKLAAILDALDENKITTTFTWQPTGPDTPLTMTYKGVTGYYLTDGNKNVLKVLRSDGTELATYTYGPFGQTLSMTGPWAQLNPFRFSSEYHDNETGLIYYNYRYYSPTLGRWINRDPINEPGGLNLYAMTDNDTENRWDEKGLSWGTVLGDPSLRSAGYKAQSEDPNAVENTLNSIAANLLPCPSGAKIKQIGGTLAKYRTPVQFGNPVSNGCGPEGLGGIVPDLIFGPACDVHDVCYGTCGANKAVCDGQFLADMYKLCSDDSSGTGSGCYLLATIYYSVVSAAGADAFEVAQDKYCLWENCCF